MFCSEEVNSKKFRKTTNKLEKKRRRKAHNGYHYKNILDHTEPSNTEDLYKGASTAFG